ncbi:MAG: HupE/UreJ family protein [Verrucomicrobiaceae bacterium]|nr:HupE/UreJ family protein [Verrucomicrobiaceae bacterium]
MTRSLFTIIAAASLSVVVPRHVELGFTHILPDGLDHILFILGLFFSAAVSRRCWCRSRSSPSRTRSRLVCRFTVCQCQRAWSRSPSL